MPHNLCLTGKKFRGCASTSLYVNANGVEIKGDVETDVRLEIAETLCIKTELVFGKKLSCNSWALKGTGKGKYGENALTGVARLDKDGTLRLAYCGDIAIPLNDGFAFVTSFYNDEGHFDEEGNLNLKGNGTANVNQLSVKNEDSELLINICIAILSETTLKKVCKCH